MRSPPVADPVAPVLLALAAILAGAKLGGDLAERIGQPAVLGELVVGILLGNLDLVGVPWFRGVAADHTIDVLAGLGVVLLLFEVGLESTVRDMLKVGGRSLLVAVLGVVTPWVLGWGVGALLLPNASPYVHAFLGATLTATSVGITARVLKDLGRAQSPEARIILGAATGGPDAAGLVWEGAPSVVLPRHDERRLEELVRPIGTLLVPIFFVLMGMRVELRSFAHPEVLGLALLLTLVAIAGKQACALGGLGASLDKLSIGIGMIPRGEVGLIFANLGLSLTLQDRKSTRLNSSH